MNKYLIKVILTILPLAIIVSSCESDATPIGYDKTQKVLIAEKELITLLLNSGRFDEASKKIEANLSIYKDNIELNTLKIYMLIASGKNKEAELLANSLLLKNRSNPLLYAALSKIHRQNKDYEKARSYIKLSLSITQNIAYTWFEKGILEYTVKEFKSAELSFNKAYMIDKSYKEAYFFRYLCRIYNKKNIDDIKDQWKNFIETTDKKSFYFTYHANALYENDMTDDAAKIITEGLSLFPEDPYLLNFSAYINLKKWIIDKDEALLTKAKEQIDNAEIYITTPETADTRLLYLKLSGDNLSLKSEFEKYLLIFPDSDILLKWRKEIYENK